MKQIVGPRLLALASLLLVAGCATGLPPESLLTPGAVPRCGGQGVPPGWPERSSEDPEALLKPFLSCASPTEFLALQRHVDMPWLVTRLDAWRAVRLGALGPVLEEAAGPLNRQRTTFLLQSLERYGAANTEVLAAFVLDTSHDDDLRDILFRLAQDKRLVELIEQLPSLGPAREARGFKPSAHAERDFQWSDVGRALNHAGRDALATSPVVNGLSSTLMEFRALEAQLPPPYQRALETVEDEQREQQFSAKTLSLGFLDHMTFGVPLSLYGLAAGTAQGVTSLEEGRYEQAVRELAPPAVLVAVFAGGKGATWLAEARGVSEVGMSELTGLEVMRSRMRSLQDVARQVQGLLGREGVSELAGYIRARREAGRLVAVGGMDAAMALHETRGDVARAQAMLSRAHPGATGAEGGPPLEDEATRASEMRGPSREHAGGLVSLVDEQVGLTREVVETRFAQEEVETQGPRLPANVAVLEQARPSLEAPPPGAEGNPRWSEYVTYRERRLGELREGMDVEGPLRWEAYEQMWRGFTRGLVFERTMIKLLRADAELPRAARRYLGDFERPRVEAYVGVWKPRSGLRFADVLVIEESPSSSGIRRVETFSFKSRAFSGVEYPALEAQVVVDAQEALSKYGETLDIRRESLRPFSQESQIPITRVRLIYESKAIWAKNMNNFKSAVLKAERNVKGVGVSSQ